MKCEICKKQIQELFLKKIKGTFVKDEIGKKHAVCDECQTRLDNSKEIMLSEMK